MRRLTKRRVRHLRTLLASMDRCPANPGIRHVWEEFGEYGNLWERHPAYRCVKCGKFDP